MSITHILSKVYEKLISQKISSFYEKYGLLPAAQFAYWNGLGCTDALLTISQHLQMSLDAGMKSNIVQLDFSATFNWVSHSGLLFKLKSIGAGGSVVPICTEFLSDRRQRVVVDGCCDWVVPYYFWRATGGCIGFSSIYCIYQRNVWAVWEQTICLCRWPHYWQFFTSQQTALRLMPHLTGTWLGFRSGAITGALYWTVSKRRV